jgi:hypothetical protein
MTAPVQPRKPVPGRSLAESFPEVAKQWDRGRNGALTPQDVLPGTHRKAWWRCPRAPEHVWQADISSRSAGRGCPYCANRKIDSSSNLAYLYPDVARTWHPTRNGTLRPDEVPPGSPRHVWWRCRNASDHEWRATIYERAKRGTGCPFCAARRLSLSNSLARARPDLAKFWHPTKNGAFTPRDVSATAHLKVWWRCSRTVEHVWEATVGSRSRGNGCPYCSNRRVGATNNLAHLHPALARTWHPVRNGTLRADQVPPGTPRVVWWKCPKAVDHEWRAAIYLRAKRGKACPFCAGYRLSVTNCLARVRPDVAKLWHLTKNGALTPWDVFPGSGRLVWWKCPRAPDHVWHGSIATRARHGCPFCKGRRVCASNSLANVAPSLAAQWHPRRNGKLRPVDVFHRANRVAWWNCGVAPDHEWHAVVADRRRSGAGCPFCAGRRVSVTNSLAKLFPKVARQWHHARNHGVTPADVLAATRDLVWWRCALGHEWRASVRARTAGGKACPMCAEFAAGVAGALRPRVRIT